jgi:hypothetical protein
MPAMYSACSHQNPGTLAPSDFSVADDGFIRSQAPQVHPFMFVIGGFNPAAHQLNPPEPELVEVVVVVVVGVLPEPKRGGAEGGFGMENDGVAERSSAPGFGVSHTMHFSLADAGFVTNKSLLAMFLALYFLLSQQVHVIFKSHSKKTTKTL